MQFLSQLWNAKRAHAPDYVITILFGLLILLGLGILASASSHVSAAQFGDSYYYLKHQIYFGLSLGLIGFFAASRIYYGVYNSKIFSIGFLACTLILVLLVFTPLGFTAKGATRWLELGPITFQPAEFLKLSLVMYLASWLAFKDHRQKNFRTGFLPFAIVLTVVSGVLILQRSTSPVAMLLVVAIVLYFVSGARLRYLAATALVGIIGLALIIGFTGYRSQRIQTFLNPEADANGAGYHSVQAKTAIGAGGVFGVGYGQSVVKYRLPETIGDSVFAVVGEEFGFIGSVILVLLFTALVLRMYVLGYHSPDPFGRLLLVGFATIIGVQAFVNMSAMTGLLPLTGTPLPFVSYGGTALAIFMTMMGVAVNVSRYTNKA